MTLSPVHVTISRNAIRIELSSLIEHLLALLVIRVCSGCWCPCCEFIIESTVKCSLVPNCLQLTSLWLYAIYQSAGICDALPCRHSDVFLVPCWYRLLLIPLKVGCRFKHFPLILLYHTPCTKFRHLCVGYLVPLSDVGLKEEFVNLHELCVIFVGIEVSCGARLKFAIGAAILGGFCV